MPANVFLTGPIRFGKSTLLSQAISESSLPMGGYFVQRLIQAGRTMAFRVADIAHEPYIPDIEVREIDKYTDIIGYIGDQMTWHPEVLEEKGTALIRQALSTEKTLVLMDELGRIELKAPGFRQAVFDALDSQQLVLGVLKQESNAFLDAIRSRENVLVLDLNHMTHQAALHELTVLIKAKQEPT
ncbi:MAG: nucleoside-triphosphatase [Syntrophomonadaceae bacterium]|nr:nucleoside-triphosphatase [Syntrophomonadaceae bacterium]